jgi:outer membrane protein TolC
MTFAPVAVNRPALLVRPLLAATLAVITAFGPISPAFGQTPAQTPPMATAPAPSISNPKPQASPIPVTLEVSKRNYTNGPRVLPNLIAPYKPISIPHEDLRNSPRIDQLIHDGKLQITLQDTVELALENSLDIIIQRYVPWYADTDILRAKAGGTARGSTTAANFPASSANLPFFNLDPVISQTVALDDRSTPLNNPFLSGSGTSTGNTLIGLKSHTDIYNTTFTESFFTGTTFNAAWDNTRGSTSPTANFLNPSVQSTLTVGFTQQLLNGCCLEVNRRNLYIAKNDRKIADLAFAQQAITTVTTTITDYWELVFARENVKVEEQAVSVSEKLFNDNKKQLEIGTMAPLDVTRAEAQLATDRQNLIVARTTQLQDEQVLKNAISKDPLSATMINVEIVPTELPSRPEAVEAPTFEDALKEAFAKRPDVLEQVYNLKNADIDVAATRNALRPILSLTASISSVGLAGNSVIPGTSTLASSGEPIVDANGNPILIGGNQAFVPTFLSTSNGLRRDGFVTAQSQLFQGKFPDFQAGLNLQLPLRNRSAQADNMRSILTQRQVEALVQQIRNNALLDVRTSYINLEQGRAAVDAAIKARELQQQTFDAEQKKYALGASTVYNVILTQRDYVSAQGVELRALANLVEFKANYERALGRTLEVNRVTIADAKGGQVFHDTLIPGTRDGKVIGTDKLFSNSTVSTGSSGNTSGQR